jgi:hypothetical protein
MEDKLKWHKRCATGACIEVARYQQVHLRDSQDPAGPRLVFAPHDWKMFVAGLRNGRFE